MKLKKLCTLALVCSMVLAGCGSTTNDDVIYNVTEVNGSSSSYTGSSTTITATPTTKASDNSSSGSTSGSGSSSGSTQSSSDTETAPTASPVKDAESEKTDITSEFKITTSDGKYTVSGTTYTITSAGTYTLSGVLADGSIYINVGDEDKVTLELNGVSITCTTTSPILCENADKLKIKAEEGTYNEIIDARAARTEDTDTANGAIYTTCDLDISGHGTLYVSASYNNGIHVKDSLSIKNVTLKVTALNTALRGNDEVEIESGNIILISEGGDGIKTTNSDISSKGNQRGNITILGGSICIYACCDGINASYNANISGDAEVTIYTNTYSEYTTEKVSSGSDFYLILSSTIYSTKYSYYAYFYNDDYSAGVWEEATYSTMISNGRTRYYGLEFTMPSGYSNVQYFCFNSGATPSTSEFVASSNTGTVNSSKNAYLISSLYTSTGVINGDYTSVSMSSGQNSNKSTYSSKGIKADNEVIIESGIITISSNDDGIHANNTSTLENNESALGNITISGGTISIIASDDGIHADNEVTINDGYINITKSYEGIEGNLITINGGSVYVYASDDGLNACSGNSTPLITVNGGYVDVTTPSGDTDAIDSNGNVSITGGFVLVKGGSSQGSMAGSIDVDGKITVTGGTVVALGGICETPTNSVNGYVSSSTSFKAGTYELKDSDGNTICTFTLSKAYTNGWWSSDEFVTGTTYTLYKDGSSLVTWTQTSGTMNASSTSGFGGGGFGGGGFGGRR